MLFVLTGDIQIGKTRWLEALASDLAAKGALCSGVIAPGDWRRNPDGSLEKLGIDNLLLPEGRRIPFARRHDLARAEGTYRAESASARANHSWEISDDAIDEVNACFDRLARREGPDGAFGGFAGPELLVVDEFGQLELLRNEGLTSALALVEAGTPKDAQWPKHCLVVVRDLFVPLAEERFGDVWGETLRIGPDDEAKSAIEGALGLGKG